MEPRAHGTHPKPSSAYKNWADVARIHRRFGLPTLDSCQLVSFVKALTADYQRRYGFDALLEKRKEPIRDAEYAHLLNLPEGTRLGPFTYHRHSRFGVMWKALHSVLNGTGFRKAEWAVSARGDSTLMTYAQLAWQLDGHVSKQGLTRAQSGLIYAGRISAVAIIYPVPSKCDPDGSAFCNKGVPFPVDIKDPECAGSLLLEMESAFLPLDRRAWPLFGDSEGRPLLGSDMDRALHDALSLIHI